jgi:hypothetical protein
MTAEKWPLAVFGFAADCYLRASHIEDQLCMGQGLIEPLKDGADRGRQDDQVRCRRCGFRLDSTEPPGSFQDLRGIDTENTDAWKVLPQRKAE